MVKFGHGDKEIIEKAVQDKLDWLGNQLAEKDGLEAKLEELEGEADPIMSKVGQAAGGSSGLPDGLEEATLNWLVSQAAEKDKLE
eukprot:10570283-Alexandrium_andersonii.AAC.1